MARKNNIHSMRFTDDMMEMIEAQSGENFSQKFENLVTRCMWELPEKEKQLANIEKEIEKKRKELDKLGSKYYDLSLCFTDIAYKIDSIGKSISKELKKQ